MARYSSWITKIGAIATRLGQEPVSEAAFDRAVGRINELAAKASDALKKLRDVDDTPMAVQLDGTAEAVGVDTHAQGQLRATLTDHGSVSVAVGCARFEAAASGGAEVAFADAGSLVVGADLVLSADVRQTGANWEVATHKFVAIDFDCVELARAITWNLSVEKRSSTVWSVADGNVATADFDVVAEGEHSLAQVDVDVLTVEDRYSGSTVDATLAIG
jgi:hypothetical protein